MKYNDITQYLKEDWDNLHGKVDPVIINAVSRGKKYRKDGAASTFGINNLSSVKGVSVKAPGSIYNLLSSQGYAGIIMQVGLDQMLCITVNTQVIFNKKACDDSLGGRASTDIFYEFKNQPNNDKDRDWVVGYADSPNIKRMIKTIWDAAKKESLPLVILGITGGEERTAVRSKRIVSQSGREKSWHDYAKAEKYRYGKSALESKKPFNQRAKEEILARLEKYRAEKARNSGYKTPEEFFKDLLSKGYMQKISIDDVVYQLKAQPLNAHALLGVKWDSYEKNNSVSYIRYVADNALSPRLKELGKELKVFDARKQAIDWDDKNPEYAKIQAEEAAKRAELQQQVPPAYIDIVLGIKGSAIVPVGLRASENKVGIY